jgi:hypothetical protein
MTVYPVDDDPYLATVGDRMRASERHDKTHLYWATRQMRADEYATRKATAAIAGLIFTRGLLACLIAAAIVVAVALY